MVLVALAGPGTNVLLAIVSSLLFFGGRFDAGRSAQHWAGAQSGPFDQLNAMLCVFNMLPLPPLDGGRVAVGLLPRRSRFRWRGSSPTAC